MYECILVILTELRTGGGAFLAIQFFCKKIKNKEKKLTIILIR